VSRTDDTRKAYETLLRLWKDAEGSLPLLAEARHELGVVR
jgi:hypothetical protein